MAIVIRTVRNRQHYGLKAFVDVDPVIGDLMFEGTFRQTQAIVRLDAHDGYSRYVQVFILEAVGELKFCGVYGCPLTIERMGIQTTNDIPRQTVIPAERTAV
jgi:hypothetical protein